MAMLRSVWAVDSCSRVVVVAARASIGVGFMTQRAGLQGGDVAVPGSWDRCDAGWMVARRWCNSSIALEARLCWSGKHRWVAICTKLVKRCGVGGLPKGN